MNESNVTETNSVQATNLAHLTRVPVEVTVELGRAERSIKDILDLGAGSLIELESIVGEPVDLLKKLPPHASDAELWNHNH